MANDRWRAGLLAFALGKSTKIFWYRILDAEQGHKIAKQLQLRKVIAGKIYKMNRILPPLLLAEFSLKVF